MAETTSPREREKPEKTAGIELTPISRPYSAPPAKMVEMIFDLASWRGTEGFTQRRRLLQDALVSSSPANKDIAWLNLGRFYFAQGLIPESFGALQAIQNAEGKDIQALKAACLAFLGKDSEAEQILSHPSFEDALEKNLILGFVESERANWEKAGQFFQGVLPAISEYPHPWRQRLRMDGAEALIEIGALEAAGDYLHALEEDHPDSYQQAMLNYLEARRLSRAGQAEKAMDLLAKLGDSTAPDIRVKATLALLEMKRARNRIDTASLAQELEKLRYQWRGDEIEFSILKKLGRLYLELGNPREAFSLWRIARRHFPALPQSLALQPEMVKEFGHFFISQAAKHMGSMEALSFYQDFRDLVPSGEEGTRLANAIVERMVDADLLSEADTLLTQLMEGTKGIERALQGNKLARLRMTMDDPQGAIAALEKSTLGDMPENLKLERRRIEAMARFSQGDTLLALNLLKDDTSEEGAEARLSIYWQLREWQSAASELRAMIDKKMEQRKVIDRPLRELLFRQAVAMNLAADKTGLADLKRRYAFGFPDDEMGRGFVALTAPLQLNSISGKLVSADQLVRFVSESRKQN